MKPQSGVHYIIKCYEKIPEHHQDKKVFFLFSILNPPGGGLSFTTNQGEEGLEKMKKSYIETHEPELYEWADLYGYVPKGKKIQTK
jgi:hypothetical protein